MQTPNCLEKFRSEIVRRQQRAEELADAAAVCEDVARLFGGHVYIRDIAGVELLYVLDELSSFDRVVPLLQEFARRGFHTDKQNPFADLHQFDIRHYYMTDTDRTTTFAIEAKLASDGATCRRVQVGVKEEPVYEFVCD